MERAFTLYGMAAALRSRARSYGDVAALEEAFDAAPPHLRATSERKRARSTTARALPAL
jgi:hypothetical protein